MSKSPEDKKLDALVSYRIVYVSSIGAYGCRLVMVENQEELEKEFVLLSERSCTLLKVERKVKEPKTYMYDDKEAWLDVSDMYPAVSMELYKVLSVVDLSRMSTSVGNKLDV